MIAGFPVVIFDTEYHKNLCQYIDIMVQHESISPEDMKLLFVTDSVADLVDYIKKYAIKKFGLKKKQYKNK
jgi:predicted Rossmann-fold nucleotide-binding protein